MNIKNKEQWNGAFFEACVNGEIENLCHLCKRQYMDLGCANIHVHDEVGFRWACMNGHLEVVKYLLTSKELKEAGHSFADFHAMNEEGFRRACRHGQLEVVKYLLTSTELIEAGHTFSNLHANDEEGFRMACYHGHLEVIQYLLTSPELIEAGHTWADAHALRDQSFHLAFCRGHWDVVRWLVLDYGIEKTPTIEEMIEDHPQVQEYFRVRDERQAIHGVLQNNETDRMTDPPSEKTNIGSFKKAKKL